MTRAKNVCLGLLVPLSLALLFACTRTEPASSAQNAAATPAEDPVKRGEYLVAIMACNDCHTPMKMGATGPEPDMDLYLSGHPEALVLPPAPKLDAPFMWASVATNTAFAGPWGVSYAINLTSDQNTGLGIWTEEMFVNAIRTGKHFGTSRTIMPPMPWPAYKNATDEDLKAVFAYLKTVKPIANRVPEYQPPAAPPAATK